MFLAHGELAHQWARILAAKPHCPTAISTDLSFPRMKSPGTVLSEIPESAESAGIPRSGSSNPSLEGNFK